MKSTINNSNFQNRTSEQFNEIIIKKARENNLKNVSINIPREKLVVITGISGSGKSSLAFDTIYAEGQRRYIDCLSAYARQFIGQLKKPDVDLIEGLSPAISIEQKTLNHNPRSTVGTTTEIYDYIRLLFTKLGTQYCVDCNVPVIKRTIEQIISDVYKTYKNKSVLILAPLVFARKGQYNDLFINLIAQGFTRVRVDGIIMKLSIDLSLQRYKNHNIELIVDKCLIDQDHEKRITASINLAIQRSGGTLMLIEDIGIHDNDKTKDNDVKIYSTNYSCPKCNKSYRKLAPNMFSFNSIYGACPVCNGLGKKDDFDENLLIPNKEISIADGAIEAIGKKSKTWLWNKLYLYAINNKISLDKPINKLTTEEYNIILYGTKTESNNKSMFNGLIPHLQDLYNDVYSTSQQRELDAYRREYLCDTCNGARLKPESLAVKIDGRNINDIVNLDIEQNLEYFNNFHKNLKHNDSVIAKLITKEISDRLSFLIDVGLPYFTLNRPVNTLSGGEAQRIRLASQIGSQLVGITYVLDEPSIGLHQHDNHKLIDSLKKLRDLGNSVIIVEHDKATIEESDYVVDIGPGAGIHGGEILLESETNKLSELPDSIKENSQTYQYIANIRSIELPENYRKPDKKKYLELYGATGNNLKNVDLKIPLGLFVCITGMSGSGKSTLINDTLYPILSNQFHHSTFTPLEYKKIDGLEHIDKVIEIDQKPIGRTPRSNPATYTKIFDIIRTFFSNLPESQIRGYKPGRFSFNIPGGRCEECEGAGIKKLAMNFLPDVYVNCDTCNGKRYNEETLQVKYKGKSIADILDMTVEESLSYFENIPKLYSKLKMINDVGLSYIKLGQQAPTLSGGEAQRVKLATELSRPSTGKTIFLLDEPTTGLHFEDISVLLKLLQKLVDKSNTIIIIEHNLDVIKCADWIIDLGPEGGNKGGYIIAEGNPIQIANNPNSITGKYLKREMRLK
jgi:excinuclease ABC subunit A